jgi:hypothetical protein
MPKRSSHRARRWSGASVLLLLAVPTAVFAIVQSGGEAAFVQAKLLGQYDKDCQDLFAGSEMNEDGTLSSDSLARCFGESLTLPKSSAEVALENGVSVVITQDEISVDGSSVVTLVSEPDPDHPGQTRRVVPAQELKGQMITRLYDRLLEKAEGQKASSEVLSALTQRDDFSFKGRVLVSVDHQLSFAPLRQVMYTAGQAQFGEFRFVVHNPWEERLVFIDITLPTIGTPQPVRDEQEEKPSLTLSLLITDKGLDLFGADHVLYPDSPPARRGADQPPAVPCKTTCAGVDDYDWEELNRLFALVKAEYPDNENIIVAPESGIPYEVIVRALDIARWGPYLPLDADDGAWSYWKSIREVLFPYDVIAGGAM